MRRTDIEVPVASSDQSLPLTFCRWFRSIDRNRRLRSRSHPLNYRLRCKSGQVFPVGHSVHGPRRLDGNGRTHCHFRSRHLAWWTADGHYQANRAAVSSALVIFDLSSATVDTRLCGVAKKDVDNNHKTSHTLFPPAATNTTLRRIRQRKQHRIKFFKN